MKKLITLAVSVMLCLSLIALPCQATAVISVDGVNLADLYDSVKDAVVLVRNVAETWSMDAGDTVSTNNYGTGVYIAPGYVLTNWNVVYDADYMEVESLNGQVIRARNVYTDESTDLAVLELQSELTGIDPVPLGDSTALRVGDAAIVIANHAVGDMIFPASLTVGVISGLNRSSENMGYFTRSVPLIQFDASLNMGCAGGAMINAQGELVGLTTLRAGLVDDDVYHGLNFAIPTQTISKVAADLMEHGAVRRPRMGIAVIAFDGPEEPIRTYPPAGMLVDSVEEGGPADQAGLMKNDIITEFCGVRIHTYAELTNIMDTMSPGDVAHVKVYRCLDDEGYMIDDPEFMEFDIELDFLD